ncbi:E3 ubiquitin-protein ligase Topors-like [Orycteropus afer afer]|uniref:RING-type E3 ubiquitin transferase n=1 Tax=Orycteropus afer afer TaxID=1230840 RepID=A0A8B7AVF6_ORYAF|nr:E3 ubiquitin-protein ligase Topors-like [Orycteropus afer afer]
MPLDRSSDCECSSCSEDIQKECNWNPCCNKYSDDSLYSRSRKKSSPSCVQYFPSQCCPTRPDSDTKEEDAVFLPSEEERSLESSQNNNVRLISEGTARKIRPLRELTIQELLSEFGDNTKLHPNVTSLGHFKDQVAMKFRRALYYSGIWVSYIQGNRIEKHLSANYFKRNPGCLHRLIPWLKRELTAVYGDYGHTVKTILATILQHMTEYDLDNESFTNLLEPYLLQHTHHFLHEFISFVHSPYNMENYDQRAIYQCSAPSPRMKKKSIGFAPFLPLPVDKTLLISHPDTRQAENTQWQWTNEEKPLSDLKPFPNAKSSLKKSDTSRVHHKTARKTHVWMKNKPEPGDHKGTCPTNSILNWTEQGERGTGLVDCKTHVQQRKTERVKLFPGQVQDLGKSETMTRTLSTPTTFNQGQTRKCGLSERRVLSLGQQENFQKKEVEKNKYPDSSPKYLQRRLPRERSLSTCKARKRDPSWGCTSETALSPKRESSRKLCAFRKKKTKFKQSSQFAEVGSHSSRTIKRRSRSRSQRSKSWCIGQRRRSLSRESSNFSLKGSYRGKYFTQNISCEPSKEKNANGYELNHGQASSITVQSVKLSATPREKPKYPTDEDTSDAGSCDSPMFLEIERHRSPRKQKMRHRPTFPRARKSRALGHRKNECCFPDKQIIEEFRSDVWDQDDIRSDVWDQDDIRQMSSPLYASSYRRQIQKKQNVNLQRCYWAMNER